jgi:hypothetical protein
MSPYEQFQLTLKNNPTMAGTLVSYLDAQTHTAKLSFLNCKNWEEHLAVKAKVLALEEIRSHVTLSQSATRAPS